MKSDPMVTIIDRYSMPTKLDYAAESTICRSKMNDTEDIWIQVSADEEKPHWIRMGSFLEIALKDHLFSCKFISQLMKLHRFHEDNPFQKISEIINPKR